MKGRCFTTNKKQLLLIWGCYSSHPHPQNIWYTETKAEVRHTGLVGGPHYPTYTGNESGAWSTLMPRSADLGSRFCSAAHCQDNLTWTSVFLPVKWNYEVLPLHWSVLTTQ